MAEDKQTSEIIGHKDKEDLEKLGLEQQEAPKVAGAEMPAAGQEKNLELQPEGKSEKTDETAAEKNRIENTEKPVITGDPQIRREKQKIKIEKILEKGLEKIYASLPFEERQRFKAKGEETANKILTLMEDGKIEPRTVVELSRKWLRLLPNVQAPFIEQDVKVKTDAIMKLGKSSDEFKFLNKEE